ncbi:MAG: winged helix-turn-helix domain-containing protein [Chloroflexia bacterium]
MCVDFDAQKVWIGDDELALSPTEFRLFRTLSMHLGRVVTHREILDQVWGEHRPEPFERYGYTSVTSAERCETRATQYRSLFAPG